MLSTVFVSPVAVSVDVTDTVRSKSTSESVGGMTLNLSRSPSSSVHVPSPLSVPADKVAPLGTPEMVTDRRSEPSVSVRLASMLSGMALSS